MFYFKLLIVNADANFKGEETAIELWFEWINKWSQGEGQVPQFAHLAVEWPSLSNAGIRTRVIAVAPTYHLGFTLGQEYWLERGNTNK